MTRVIEKKVDRCPASTLFCITKDFALFLFPDTKHLKGRSVPRVRHFFWHTKDFVIFLFPDSFRIQRILPFSCFWTLSVFKGFCPFPVSRHFPYSRDFVVSLFPDTFFPYSKILLYLLFPDTFGTFGAPCV